MNCTESHSQILFSSALIRSDWIYHIHHTQLKDITITMRKMENQVSNLFVWRRSLTLPIVHNTTFNQKKKEEEFTRLLW